MSIKVRRSYLLASVFMVLGAVIHTVAQVGSHLHVIGDMLQEILIIIGLIFIFSPAVYAMRYSLRHKIVAYLLLFGVTAKAKTAALPLKTLWPQLTMLLVSAVAVTWGVNRFLYEHESAVAVNSFWLTYHFCILMSIFYFNKER